MTIDLTLPNLLAVTLSDLLDGHNVIFVAVFGLGLFFTLMSVLGLGSHGDADVDASADVDVHADVDAHADVDVHADADADVGADVDHHAEAHAGLHDGGGILHSVLSFLGVGRAPLSVVITVFCYAFALIGAAVSIWLEPRIGSSLVVPLSLVAAFTCGALVARSASRMIGRFLPTFFTTAQRRLDLVGLSGEVTLPVTERFGQVFVRDRFGTLHSLNCRTLPGTASISKGTRVVLVKYKSGDDLFFVAPA